MAFLPAPGFFFVKEVGVYFSLKREITHLSSPWLLLEGEYLFAHAHTHTHVGKDPLAFFFEFRRIDLVAL